MATVVLFVGVFAEPQLGEGYEGTCALWAEDLKCWGLPEYYDPAYASGDSTDAVTVPPADPFDLGQDFISSQVIPGRFGNCAVSVEGAVRCWGDKSQGLGYGNTLLFRCD